MVANVQTRLKSDKVNTRLHQFRLSLSEGVGFIILMMFPALFVLGFVVGVPILKAIWLSFDTIALRRPAAAGTYGLHNYEALLTDESVWKAILLSAIYMTGTVVGSLSIALSAALLTRKIVRFRALVRLVFLLPWTVPAVVTALVWGVMYEGNFGIINRLFEYVPFLSGSDWLIDRQTVLPALIIAQVWNEFSVAYIFLLAGLFSIPTELYEAAQIDRASPFQQFIHITLPQLRYVVMVTVILLLIMGFKAFPIIYILTGGGPAGASETLTILTYNTAFRSLDFSYAATLGLLATLISLLLVSVYLYLMKSNERSKGGGAI